MESLKFTGSGSEYFKIWIVNILLTIITVGFYYPWAKVRNRRYFYANSTLNSRNFEYHATGLQLLLGFIIGLVLFVIYTFVTQLAPQFAGIFMLLFMLILPWLVWRSLMFNMKMTSFSNVHFSFRGTLGKSYKIFLGYPILLFLVIMLIGVGASVLVPFLQDAKESASASVPEFLLIGGVVLLGLAFTLGYLYFFAIMKKATTEYTLSNAYYGQGEFDTDIETKKFFMIILKAIGLIIVPMGIFAGIFFMTLEAENREIRGILFVIAYFGSMFFMMFMGAYIVSRERKYVYENTLLDNKIGFESTLRARDLAWVMISNLFLIMVTLGLAFPWAKVRVANLMLENTLVDTSIGFDEYLSQKQNEVSSIGDQIGEAFDIDVGVAF